MSKPVKHIRLGTLSASIWKRSGTKGDFHTVNFQRSWKDGKEWKNGDSFNRDDLLTVAKLADLAHTWIWKQEAAKTAEE